LPIIIGTVDAALLTRLRTGSGKQIGDAKSPYPVGTTPAYPYGIQYPIPGGDRDGPISDPHADLILVYQVTCVGQQREQARWLADRIINDLLFGAVLVVVGAKVTFVELEVNPGVERDDTTGGPPLYVATPRFRLSLTPA
jgi:hypothetical protein